MKLWQWSTLLVACLLMAGCDDSKTPLSDPQTSKADMRLAGVWRLRNGDGNVTYYHVGLAGGNLPKSMMRVVSVTHPKDNVLYKPGGFFVFATHLPTGDYLNMMGGEKQASRVEKNGWSVEADDSFFFLKYQLEGDTLLVRMTNSSATKQAVQAGKIKGMIRKPKDKDNRETVRFTDTTENLARFVASAGDSLFVKKAMKLERVK